MKKLVLFLMILAFVAGLGVIWEGFRFLGSGAESTGRDLVFIVSPGEGFYKVAERLKSEGLITNSTYFKILAKLTGSANQLRIGEYAVRSDARPMDILAILASGKSIERKITFPEGWNRFEMAGLVESAGIGTKKEFLDLTTNPQFIQETLGEKVDSLEGYLFPETYSYTKFSGVEELVRSMVAGFRKAYDGLNFDPAKVGLSRHQFVTLASVIEKETGAEADRPYIASVFHNRLKKGMRLQSDPTILYGLMMEKGVMPANITRDDILHPSPWNTYTVSGVPAGPIANPGLKALNAAANPAVSNYFYFVSKNDGTTSFSESLADHNSAVQKFQVNQSGRTGKSWRDLGKKTEEKPKALAVPSPATKKMAGKKGAKAR